MPIDTEVRDQVLLIRLNRPEAMNAIDPGMFEGLDEAWTRFDADDSLRVAIVTGAGERAFCAGRDLVKSVNDEDGDWSQQGDARRSFTPERTMKPVIAAINGHCLAAGLALALACDIRLASDNATFGTMAAKRGIVAGAGQIQRLARYVPFGMAMELILMGERIDAAEAHRIGLVNRVMPQDELLDTAFAWAGRLCRNGPLALRAMKEAAIEGGLNQTFDDAMRTESRLYSDIMKTEDAAEGARAFAEKREPRFRGR